MAVRDLKDEALANKAFRKVLWTNQSQLTLMSLLPHQDIGEEVHKVDQFIVIVKGSGNAVLDGVVTKIHQGSSIYIDAGTKHNILALSERLQLYTIYSQPIHKIDEYQVYKPIKLSGRWFVLNKIEEQIDEVSFPQTGLQVVWSTKKYAIALNGAEIILLSNQYKYIEPFMILPISKVLLELEIPLKNIILR
jgi:mannose-6-phosphate isomerase-like protein (cupin superfamily)